ncbi:DNA polymerase-3 subunit epsilon [Desulfobotulus alkaliphilus]|uniref:DNA polymerase-3 subunit epsilon n=1 Tax=Desulfobotulus alkaliphilus TaxID=622671 RepID=A0A562RQC6_9BACT|nr:3'-5' exonuclease [Desulfobotulus alkaliphilus]TWI70744.1 DNA polymerase-3 subunit epsilon [Desulfobotulus alkaliphilus]
MLYFPPEKKKPRATPCWPDVFVRRAAEARSPLLQYYYGGGVVDGDTPLSKVLFLALDIETTGLHPGRDAIVSIGAVPFTLERIFSSRSRYWVVNPGRPLTPDSVVIHGITHSRILNSPDLMEVIPDLLAVMAGAVIVVHCRQVERLFLDAALRKSIGEGIDFPVIDTMEIEASYFRRGVRYWLSQFFGLNRYSIRLADSRTRYHLPQYRPHHALTDALATAELFQAQAACRFDPDMPVKEIWL